MIQIAHAITNLDTTFAEADEVYCELLQLTPVELGRRDILSVTFHADRARNGISLHRLIDQGTPFWIRKRYIRDDGSLVWVLNHVNRVVGLAGRIRIAAASFILPIGIGERGGDTQDPDHPMARADMLRSLL